MRICDLLQPKLLGPWYNSDTSMMIEGPPGGGKSSICVKDIPEILSELLGVPFGVHSELATDLDAPDVRGFLVPSKDKDGRGISYFTRSGILPSREYLEKHPYGIYIIEERSQAQLLTQTALAPVVLQKKFGSDFLPPGWRIISNANRLSDKAGVIRPPMHLINRETKVSLTFDITSSATWWEANGMHPMGIAYAKAHPGVFADKVPAIPEPYNTCRSYTMAWKFLADVAGNDVNGNPAMKIVTDHASQELVQGYIGEGSAAELFAFLKVADELPTIEEIIKDPKKAKAPERLDAAYAGLQLCLHHAESKNIDAIWQWTERLPIELQTSAAKSMLKKSGGALLNSPRLSKWIAKNRALVLQTTA